MLFRFLSFPVYKKAKKFRRLARGLLKKFPSSEKYLLVDQILRALLSICLNIAEGSNRKTDKDKASFLNRSLTSLEEVVSGFDLALEDGYINEKDFENIIEIAEDLGKQLIGFGKHLNESSKKKSS